MIETVLFWLNFELWILGIYLIFFSVVRWGKDEKTNKDFEGVFDYVLCADW